MSELSVVEAQLNKAQDKLDAMIKSRSILEEDFNTQSSLLTQFISKLSLVCKGIDLELDNRLAKFRVLLTKSAPISEIEQEISTISDILKQHASKNERYIREMHEQMHTSGKTLQKINGLPNQVRRNLRQLLTENTDHKEALIQYIPKLNELIHLYQQAITGKMDLTKTNFINDSLEEAVSNNNDVKIADHTTIIKQIIRLVNDIQLSDPQLIRLADLKQKFSKKLNNEELLGTLVELFNLIIEDMRTERKAARSFLSSLSKALVKVQGSITSTVNDHDEFQSAQNKINHELTTQLTHLTQTVDQSPTLVEIKDDIQEKLVAIAGTLSEKSNAELSYSHMLSKKLHDMQSKVQTLEKQSKAYEKQLAEQKQKSMRDALTQLHNRAAFDEYFALRLAKHHQSPFELAICVLDLDDFKRINDTYGHIAGDKTLQVMANTLRKNISSQAFAARYGGEEFVIIYSGVSKAQLLDELDSLRQTIVKLPFKFKSTKVNISASFGVTYIQPSDNIHTAFERADSGLYQAKEKGKNQIIYV